MSWNWTKGPHSIKSIKVHKVVCLTMKTPHSDLSSLDLLQQQPQSLGHAELHKMVPRWDTVEVRKQRNKQAVPQFLGYHKHALVSRHRTSGPRRSRNQSKCANRKNHWKRQCQVGVQIRQEGNELFQGSMRQIRYRYRFKLSTVMGTLHSRKRWWEHGAKSRWERDSHGKSVVRGTLGWNLPSWLCEERDVEVEITIANRITSNPQCALTLAIAVGPSKTLIGWRNPLAWEDLAI
jgi:hypothetical protein